MNEHVVYEADLTAKTQRTCGDCQLCCVLIPVRELGKKDGERCKHQCRKGCAIYSRRPPSCQIWTCQWRRGDDTGRRPDRSHLVVDCMPDFIIVQDKAAGAESTVGVLQVWMDPRYPDAHKDPGFRRYVAKMHADHGYVALIRTSSASAFLLVPPAANEEGVWLVREAAMDEFRPSHTAEEIGAALNIPVVEKEFARNQGHGGP